jgi:hypothetical protein
VKYKAHNIPKAVPVELVEHILRYYESMGTYRTESMKKADPGRALGWIEPVIRSFCPDLGDFLGGNFYRHSRPYLPHTDHRAEWGNSINVVVPLHFTDPTPGLVVFDQTWDGNSMTWTLDVPIMPGIISSSTNPQVTGRPWDTPGVKGLTGVPIDEHFAETYLQRDRSQYFGLSGTVLPFLPGSLLVFQNKMIHGTTKFQGEKTGLSLRFKDNS